MLDAYEIPIKYQFILKHLKMWVSTKNVCVNGMKTI